MGCSKEVFIIYVDSLVQQYDEIVIRGAEGKRVGVD